MADEPRDVIEPGPDDGALPTEPVTDGEVDHHDADATVVRSSEADTSDESAPGAARPASESVPESESETDTELRTDAGEADTGLGEAAGVTDDPDRAPPETSARALPLDCDRELSAQRIAAELNRIETEVRKLLEDRDPKRKRRLGGSRRWSELEEDLIALRFTGRIEEPTIAALRRLIDRRHYLFGRLRFLAMTRPTWNS